MDDFTSSRSVSGLSESSSLPDHVARTLFRSVSANDISFVKASPREESLSIDATSTPNSVLGALNRFGTRVFSFRGENPRSQMLIDNEIDTWYSEAAPLLRGDDERVVHINDPEKNDSQNFCSNEVITFKYTFYNFVPKFTLQYFRQTANFYFLLVGIAQMIPAISTTNGVPIQYFSLAAVMAIDAFFEALADRKRHVDDRKANSTAAWRYSRETKDFEKITWRDVKVGDFLKVNNRETAPADMVLLAVSEPEDQPPSGICFVETKSLDGETNLKVREAMELTFNRLKDPEDLEDLVGAVHCEQPNHDTNSFRGNLWLRFYSDIAKEKRSMFASSPLSSASEPVLPISHGRNSHRRSKNMGTGHNSRVDGGGEDGIQRIVFDDGLQASRTGRAEASTVDRRGEVDDVKTADSSSGVVSADPEHRSSSHAPVPIEHKNMILRGTTVRNTEYAYGIVVNTGKDTKVVQSSKPTPQKTGQIADIVNKQIWGLIAILVFICMVAATACIIWVATREDSATYLILEDTSGPTPFYTSPLGWLIYAFYFWGLTAAFVPITLYVTLAITKTWQAWFITQDLEMYYEPSDTPAKARNPDLNDQLGMITHIFSDKTGTLTANIMDFRKMCINGVSYGKGTTEIGRVALQRAGQQLSSRDLRADMIKDEQPPNVRFLDPTDDLENDRKGKRGTEQAMLIEEFLMAMSVCHSVIAERQTRTNPESGVTQTHTVWSASSPDEQALVAGAAFLGYRFVDRRPGLLLVEKTQGCMPRMSMGQGDYLQRLSGIGSGVGSSGEQFVKAGRKGSKDVTVRGKSRERGRNSTEKAAMESERQDEERMANTVEQEVMKELECLGKGSELSREEGVAISPVASWPTPAGGDGRSGAKGAQGKAGIDSAGGEGENLDALLSTRGDEEAPKLGEFHEQRASDASSDQGSGQSSKGADKIPRLSGGNRTRVVGGSSKAGGDGGGGERVVPTSLTGESGMVQFDVLDVLEFTSARKRMSVVIRHQDGGIRLICKGADSEVISRISTKSAKEKDVLRRTEESLERFALDGLRTLVLAERTLEDEEYLEWAVRYHQALTDLKEVDKRANGEPNAIDDLEDELETSLTLLGATAIEDRLQEGVPQCISDMMRAGIKVWVLTGDKEETAINIGFACQLLHNDMERIVVNASHYETLTELKQCLLMHATEMTQYWAENARLAPKDRSPIPPKALIIDGASLNKIFSNEYAVQLLVEFAQHCVAVVGCRVSPKQKALVVAAVKQYLGKGARTLSIGDGANDVSMIQEAHVGVGISGQEGMQAVNSSDYAIAQFAFLRRLLLVHGHWNYRRMAKMVLYIIYKNVLFQFTLYLYAIYAAWSGARFYNNMWLNGYNLLWTSVPVVAMSILDQEVPAEMAEAYPALYRLGWKNELFSWKVFWQWVAAALLESAVCVFIPLFFYGPMDLNGHFYAFWDCGAVSWSAMICVAWIKLVFNVCTWDWIMHVSFWASIALWIICAILIDLILTPDVTDWAFPYLFAVPQFYLLVLVSVCICVSRDLFWKAWKREVYPEYYHLLSEAYWLKSVDKSALDWDPPMDHLTFFVADRSLELEEEGALPEIPDRKTRETKTGMKYMGFAFSIAQEGAGVIRKAATLPLKMTIDIVSDKARHKRNVAFLEFLEDQPSDQKEVWQNERFNVLLGWGSSFPGHLLITDRRRYSDRGGTTSCADFDLTDWEVDKYWPGCDGDGWCYAPDFSAFGQYHRYRGSILPGIDERLRVVRRRRWIPRERNEGGSPTSSSSPPQAGTKSESPAI